MLLWSSPIWSTVEKWTGTLAGPVAGAGGIALFVAISAIVSPWMKNSFSFSSIWAFLVLTLVGNIWAGIRLLRGARDGPAA
jgi:hypothetical protein